jgi:copper chaperone CopZ
MKKSVIILFVFVFGFTLKSNAQKETKKNTAEITIQTSAICEQCKDRLEKEMAYTKGVKSSNLNLSDKKLTVVYNPAKTNPSKIKKAISEVGYDADEIPADKTAYDALPPCCKKGVKEH